MSTGPFACAVTEEAVDRGLLVSLVLLALIGLVVIVHSLGVLKGRRERTKELGDE